MTQQVALQKPAKRRRSASQWAVAWRRFKRNKAALVGMFMVGVLFFVAAFSNVLAKYPARPDPAAFTPFYEGDTGAPPSWKYPFGTTALGTDVYSEIIHGSIWTIYVAVGVTAITMALAIVTGITAGYFGKYVDDVIMRVAEVFLVFPSLLLILVFARIFQLSVSATYWDVLGMKIPIGLTMVVLIIAIFGWAGDARLVRGEVLRVRELEFIQAERALGASRVRILFRHIFPNVLSPIIVVATLTMASAVLIEAGVSFLGFGDPNTVTWGRILYENFQNIGTLWWAEVFPGLAVFWTVLGFNLMGDGLADALNPRLRE